LSATYNLTKGSALRFIVGKTGANGSGNYSSAGGGGSFVLYASSISNFLQSNADASANILIASGGGGGSNSRGAGTNAALNNTSGTPSSDGAAFYGTNGNGGTTPYGAWSGGSGAGLLSGGSQVKNSGGLTGGAPGSYISGFQGGFQGGNWSPAPGGGFGGGANSNWSAGGGGGYSGGSGDDADGSGNQKHGGGGGGSYMNTGHSTFIAEQGIRGPNALAGSILVELL